MPLKFDRLKFPEVILITADEIPDSRGYFVKLLTKKELKGYGIKFNLVEEFESSSNKNVIRGLHYQLYPYLEGKLVRVLSGSIFDVVVDIRKNSPNFGKWLGVNLCASEFKSIWVPPGFAHGFLALEDNTRLLYKVNVEYNPNLYTGIRWDDKEIGVEWPLKGEAIISDKDSKLPSLKTANINFEYKNGKVAGLD